MKREIKFRGKRIDNGDWVYGSYTQMREDDHNECFRAKPHKAYHRIWQWKAGDWNMGGYANYEVIPETVGKFTGFMAVKHKINLDAEIYEGDLFRGSDADDNDIFYVVMWIDQRGAFYMVPIDHYTVIRDNDVSREKEFDWLFQDALLYDFSIDVGLMKVGNIHDNPEIFEL